MKFKSHVELVLYYIREHGFIVPAFRANDWFEGKKFSSEVGRICRSLRMRGLLKSATYREDKKFVEYSFTRKGRSVAEKLFKAVKKQSLSV